MSSFDDSDHCDGSSQVDDSTQVDYSFQFDGPSHCGDSTQFDNSIHRSHDSFCFYVVALLDTSLCCALGIEWIRIYKLYTITKQKIQ